MAVTAEKKKADHSNGNVANLYLSLTVSSIMLTITPQDEYCRNPHISDDDSEALEQLLTQGHTATSEPSQDSLWSLPS